MKRDSFVSYRCFWELDSSKKPIAKRMGSRPNVYFTKPTNAYPIKIKDKWMRGTYRTKWISATNSCSILSENTIEDSSVEMFLEVGALPGLGIRSNTNFVVARKREGLYEWNCRGPYLLWAGDDYRYLSVDRVIKPYEALFLIRKIIKEEK